VIPENMLEEPESRWDSPSELNSYFFFDFTDLLFEDF
jgi:hypothetical protein